MSDLVNHPGHYTDVVPGIECIQVTQHFNFNRGNAIKYLWRAGAKGDAVEDLRKAAKYIEFEIARLEAERAEMRAELEQEIAQRHPIAPVFSPGPLGPDAKVIPFSPAGERWHE